MSKIEREAQERIPSPEEELDSLRKYGQRWLSIRKEAEELENPKELNETDDDVRERVEDLKQRKGYIRERITNINSGGSEIEDFKIDYNNILFMRTGLGKDIMNKCRQGTRKDYPYRLFDKAKDPEDAENSMEIALLLNRTYKKCKDLQDFYAYDQLKESLPDSVREKIQFKFEEPNRNESRGGSVLRALQEINPEYQGEWYEKSDLGQENVNDRLRAIRERIQEVSDEGEKIVGEIETKGNQLLSENPGDPASQEVSEAMGLSGRVKSIQQRARGLLDTLRRRLSRIKSRGVQKIGSDQVSVNEIKGMSGGLTPDPQLERADSFKRVSGEEEKKEPNESLSPNKFEGIVGSIADAYDLYSTAKKNENKEEMIAQLGNLKKATVEMKEKFLEEHTKGELYSLKAYADIMSVSVPNEDILKGILQNQIGWITRYTGMSTESIRRRIEEIEKRTVASDNQSKKM